MTYLGDFAEDETTVEIWFTTHDKSGGAIAPSTSIDLPDFKIYKDGGTSQKTATDGLTVSSPFDTLVGLHLLVLDTSNDTNDSGFWVTGSDYIVVLDPSDETVDSETVIAVIGQFSIENRFGVAVINDWTNGGRLDNLLDAIPTTVMRGTDGANTTTPPTVAEIQAEIEENGQSVIDTIRDELANGVDGLSALKTLIDAIPTTMVGTNNAFLASVGGAIDDAAAAGEVTTADTLMQYLKQLINILIGGPGIVAFPAEAAPANAVSLAEVIRAIHVDTNKLAFTVANQVDANMIAISGDSTAADRLEALMDGGIIGQVNDASATTTAFAADGFTEATDDHFKGRLITFVSGALNGQQTDITGYDAAGGTQGSQEFTVTTLTEAPTDDDFFVVH